MAGANSVEVRGVRGTAQATVVYFDPVLDLAVLKVDPASGATDRDRVGRGRRPGKRDRLPRRCTRRTARQCRNGWSNIRTADIYLQGKHIRPGYELNLDIQAGDSGAVVVIGGKAVALVWATSRETKARAWAMRASLLADHLGQHPGRPRRLHLTTDLRPTRPPLMETRHPQTWHIGDHDGSNQATLHPRRWTRQGHRKRAIHRRPHAHRACSPPSSATPTSPTHAITKLDVSAARAIPGVMAVLTADDVPDVRFGPFVQDRTLFARDVVRFEGEVIAAVAATTAAIAQQAVDAIVVEFEPLPVVTDLEAALTADAPLVHADWAVVRGRRRAGARSQRRIVLVDQQG